MELNDQQDKTLRDPETLELLEMELYRVADKPDNEFLSETLEDIDAIKPTLQQCLDDAWQYGFYPDITNISYKQTMPTLVAYSLIALKEGKTLVQIGLNKQRMNQSESPRMAILDEVALFNWNKRMQSVAKGDK